MVRVVRDALSSQLANREQALTSGSNSGTNTQEKRDGEQSAAKSAKLLFANKTEKDILWREELDQFAKTTRGR
jgi:predicted NBD/HSP70 family sugar kinase